MEATKSGEFVRVVVVRDTISVSVRNVKTNGGNRMNRKAKEILFTNNKSLYGTLVKHFWMARVEYEIRTEKPLKMGKGGLISKDEKEFWDWLVKQPTTYLIEEYEPSLKEFSKIPRQAMLPEEREIYDRLMKAKERKSRKKHSLRKLLRTSMRKK